MLERLRQEFTGLGADALLVTAPANVRYLSGFRTPSDGSVLVTENDAVLITDGRYIAQADEESRLKVDVFTGNWLEHVAGRARGLRLGIEADHLTYDAFRNLSDKSGQEPIPTKGLVAEFRLYKTPAEIDLLRQAAGLTDAAFSHILGFIRAGRQEAEVARELERFMRQQGAEDKSFDIIVASGVRSAMPHGVASGKTIEDGDLVTLDFGARVDGYHADMTRAVAVGEVRDELRALFDAVLEAQQLALDSLAPGKDGRDLDGLAREVLAGKGLARYFSHSLGHGVGLDIHEGPRLSQQVSQRLAPGMSVTVEPGVYIPKTGGVRIEDLAVITEDGYERLSHSSKEWVSV